MSTNPNQQLLDSGLDEQFLINILAKLQTVHLRSEKGEYIWNELSADYGTIHAMRDNGEIDQLSAKQQYELIREWLASGTEGYNLLNLPTLLKFWTDESIDLSVKAISLKKTIEERLTLRESSRGNLHTNLERYVREVRPTTQNIPAQTLSRQEKLRSIIQTYNRNLMDPLRQSFANPSVHEAWQRISPSGTGSPAKIQDFLLNNLGTLTSAQIVPTTPNTDAASIRNLTFARNLALLATNQGDDEIRDWGMYESNHEETTRDVVALIDQLSLEWHRNAQETNNSISLTESLNALRKEQSRFLDQLSLHTPSSSSLRDEIGVAMTNLTGSKTEGLLLAQTLIEQSLAAATREKSDARTTIERALMKLGIDPNSNKGEFLTDTIINTYGTDLGGLTNDANVYLRTDQTSLTKALLKRGLDPRGQVGNERFWEKVAEEVGVNNYPKSRTDLPKFLDNIVAEISAEKNKDQPNLLRARQLEQIYNHLSPVHSPGLIERSTLIFSNLGQSGVSLYTKSLEILTDITDNLPQNKLKHALFDIYGQLSGVLSIPIRDKAGKIIDRIPIFGLNYWLFDKFNSLKKHITWGVLKGLRGKRGKIASTLRFFLRNYAKGDYSFKFMLPSIGKEITHKALNAAARATGKYASWGALKQVVTKSIVAAATKISTKLGVAVAGALETGGLSIIITAAQILLDLGWIGLKWLWKNKDKVAVGIGSITIVAASLLGSLMAAGQGILNGLANIIGGISGVIGGIFSATASSLLAGTAAGFATLISALFIQNVHTIPPAQIDPGIGIPQIFSNIVCTLAGTGAPNEAENPRLSAGKCVYQLLSGFGINPLNKVNANSPIFNAFAAKLGNAAAAEAAKHSATEYLTFQCSGFDAVVDIMTGGVGDFASAFQLDQIRPSGYNFVNGVTNCAPGDFFVDKNDKFGHTGLFVSYVPGDAEIICMDANSDLYGKVRDETTCRWKAERIAGCLKKR